MSVKSWKYFLRLSSFTTHDIRRQSKSWCCRRQSRWRWNVTQIAGRFTFPEWQQQRCGRRHKFSSSSSPLLLTLSNKKYLSIEIRREKRLQRQSEKERESERESLRSPQLWRRLRWFRKPTRRCCSSSSSHRRWYWKQTMQVKLPTNLTYFPSTGVELRNNDVLLVGCFKYVMSKVMLLKCF